MAEATVQLSIPDLYAKVGQLLSNNLSLFNGLTISGVSIDKKLTEHPTYPNVYCIGTSAHLNGSKEAKYSINLKIPNPTITSLKKENPLVGESGTKYDIVIGNIDISLSGQITVTATSIKEAGLSDRELLNRRLTVYCEQKGYFGAQKRSLPRLVGSVVAITSDSSTISDDILSNLKLPPHKIRIYKCKTSEEIAEAITSNINLDITVLFRGGREDEHMAIFSSECIIDAIMQSKAPVCIALGHEIDRPFVYAVGDHDFSTPSAFAKAIAELNQNAINDQSLLFMKIKERLTGIKNTASDFVSHRQERIENLCKQIVIAQIKGIEIIEKKIAGCVEATKAKAISAIELRKKHIDLVVNEIIHAQKSSVDKRLGNIEILVNEVVAHKKSSIDKSLHGIERLVDELIVKEDARQKTEAIQDKANKDKRNLIAVIVVIFTALVALITYLLFKQ